MKRKKKLKKIATHNALVTFYLKYQQQIILAAVFVILMFLFLGKYEHQVNPDGTAYVAIAKFFANGNLDIAINGYWSPLFSILLVPFFILKIPVFFAVKFVSAMIAFLLVLAIRKLLLFLKVSGGVVLLICLSIIPLFLLYGLSLTTPDLLVVLIMVCYLLAILEFFADPTVKKAKWIGIFGGLGYLAKSYLLLFFFLNLLFLVIAFFFHFRKKYSLKQMLLFLLAINIPVFLISVPWIILISIKYHTFTISTSGSYNWGLIGPLVRGVPFMKSQNLVAPSDPRLPSAWVDPSFLPFPQWNPFSSQYHFNYFISNVTHYFNLLLEYITNFRMFIPLIITFIVGYIVNNKKKLLETSINTKLILIMFITFPLGYLIILVEERYIWFLFALIIIGFAQAYDMVLKRLSKNGLREWGYFILVIILGIFMYNNYIDLQTYSNNEGYFNAAQDIKQSVDLQGKNIADQKSELNWFINVSYFLDAKYYGEFNQRNITATDFYNELRDKNIDYYFVRGNPIFNMDQFPIVYSTSDNDLKLYKIK